MKLITLLFWLLVFAFFWMISTPVWFIAERCDDFDSWLDKKLSEIW